MFEVLRFRVRTRVVVIGVVAALLLAACLVMFATGHHNGRSASQAQLPARTGDRASIPLVITPRAASTSSSQQSMSAPYEHTMPETSSADVYAAAVAEALWSIDYATTSRGAVLAFWREQLAPSLPTGTPVGTTLAQAQAAAISTITDYVPSAGMWSSPAADHTVSSFTVTGVSEPSTWVAAVTSGDIADPGLTARTLVGIQKLTYRVDGTTQTTSQTQQVTVAMLCPPTTAACTVEIIPPSDSADSLP